ncbi:MAG: FAD:protein FMN transferase [Fimbriimonadia bacterium]|jgi:thiamine biosynthesis lipoprotein
MDLSFRSNKMGCDFHLVLGGAEEQAMIDASVEAWEMLDRLDAMLSHYKPKSEVSDLNARAGHMPVLVSPELLDLILYARDMWILTDGALDITVGPLSKAWGFFSGDLGEPPPGTIEAARAASGFQRVSIDAEQRLVGFDRSGVEINFAALGKGYALDRMAELLRSRLIPSAFASAGGSSAYGYGRTEGWGVRLNDPEDERRELTRLHLRDEGLSTSGPSQQSIVVGGVRRSHLIDPRTAEPSTSPITATVVAPTALEAEALSTAVAVSVAPASVPDWLPRYLERAKDVQVFLAWREPGRTLLVQLSTDRQGALARTEKEFPI